MVRIAEFIIRGNQARIHASLQIISMLKIESQLESLRGKIPFLNLVTFEEEGKGCVTIMLMSQDHAKLLQLPPDYKWEPCTTTTLQELREADVLVPENPMFIVLFSEGDGGNDEAPEAPPPQDAPVRGKVLVPA